MNRHPRNGAEQSTVNTIYVLEDFAGSFTKSNFADDKAGSDDALEVVFAIEDCEAIRHEKNLDVPA